MKRSYSQIKLYEPVLAVTRGRLMRGRLSWETVVAAAGCGPAGVGFDPES